jgi:hypothetical protein
MPYKFQYHKDDDEIFSCPLQCVRCVFNKPNGQQCKLTACIGTPYCWIHLLYQKHLRIKPSTIRGSGKGVFAMSKAHGPNDIIFQKGEIIIEYDGELITEEELQRRYGDHVAPYAASERRITEDGACRRGVGTLVNHSARPNCRLFLSNPRGSPRRWKLQALKNIKNGAECFISYGRQYGLNEFLRQGYKQSTKKSR